MLSVMIALFSDHRQDEGISGALRGRNLVQTLTWKSQSVKPGKPLVLKSLFKYMWVARLNVDVTLEKKEARSLIKRIFIFCATTSLMHLPGCQAVINLLVCTACPQISMEPHLYFSLKWILKALCYCLVSEKYWQWFSFFPFINIIVS